jgi:hypothetical protein
MNISFKLEHYNDGGEIDPHDISLIIEQGDINLGIHFQVVYKNKEGLGVVRRDRNGYTFNTINGFSGFYCEEGKVIICSDNYSGYGITGCSLALPSSYQSTVEKLFTDYFEKHNIKVESRRMPF